MGIADQSALPRFRKPPVAEVAIGVQFDTPNLTPVQLGLFYQRVKARLPSVQVHPSLPTAFETFGPVSAPPTLSFSLMGMPSPRMWFVSEDRTSLIQLQAGRLLFNWRSGPDQSAYPHFQQVRLGFLQAFDDLEAVASAEGLGAVAVNQCEVVYVNPLPESGTGLSLSKPEGVFRTWTANPGKEWDQPLEDVSFSARYRFEDGEGRPFGRLTATVTSGWGPDGSPGFQFELTARGIPLGQGREGIVAFHDYAHQAIVRCFTGMTTPEMHALWGRHQ